MRNIVVIATLICGFAIPATSQDTLTLSSILGSIEENAPRLNDREIIDQKGSLVQKNIQSSWYPSLNLNGKVSYQSDVITIDIDQPGLTLDFPAMPHEQFGVNLDVRQTIYDGGLIKSRSYYEERQIAAEMQEINVDINALREQATGLYFSVLTLQENRNILELGLENLKEREKMLISAVENEISEQADLDLIRVEILRILQRILELDAAKEGILKMLTIYTDREIDPNSIFELPVFEMNPETSIDRPELKLLELHSEVIDAGKDIAKAKRMPVVYAYGQGGVGMPGYNMLSDQVDSYYLVGAGLKWNIWDWNNSQREQQILDKNKLVLNNRMSSFTMQIQAGMEKELKQMEHYREAMELDKKMLEIRSGITANAASKVDNGTMSGTEFMQILNEENKTRFEAAAHQIKMYRAMANYKILEGTL